MQESAHRRSCLGHTLATYELEHPQRRRLERFIQHAFARHHGASVHAFMPTLVALEGQRGRVCGVVGFRHATMESLFLERYLDRPVELALAERVGHSIARKQIVEVGNLASLSCRAACHLVAALPRILIADGNEWIVFTATAAVRGMLARFQAPVIELARATRDRLDDGDEWGRYYENDPRVLAGYLPDGIAPTLATELLRA
jgi:thermostable hemolysin